MNEEEELDYCLTCGRTVNVTLRLSTGAEVRRRNLSGGWRRRTPNSMPTCLGVDTELRLPCSARLHCWCGYIYREREDDQVNFRPRTH
ncbi:uncharacterized protein G2W53_042354 [Senna tora]|uniref:Uncharacterized protein n=1 Tax=Senna tora TaxID=362788 RepID=A0A834SFV9_9FABA|nr:uncharacterized protein G2W53_042354 [Senna tora]